MNIRPVIVVHWNIQSNNFLSWENEPLITILEKVCFEGGVTI